MDGKPLTLLTGLCGVDYRRRFMTKLVVPRHGQRYSVLLDLKDEGQGQGFLFRHLSHHLDMSKTGLH